MTYTNGWKTANKKSTKLELKLRLGKVTVLELRYDRAKKKGAFTFLNFGLKN
jgi:hypothetical protein